MNIVFSDDGWDDYLYWQMQDKKTLKRINALLQDIDACLSGEKYRTCFFEFTD